MLKTMLKTVPLIILDILRDYAYQNLASVDARGMGICTKIIPLMKKFNASESEFELTDDYLNTTLYKKKIENIGVNLGA